MTIKIASLSANLAAERAGEWIEPRTWPGLDPEEPARLVPVPGLAFKVRSTLYPPFVTARQKLLEKWKRDWPKDDVPSDVQAAQEGAIYAEHLLLDWRGLDEAFDPDRAASLLRDEANRILRAMVLWCAGRVGRRLAEFVEAEAKNSEGSSATA